MFRSSKYFLVWLVHFISIVVILKALDAIAPSCIKYFFSCLTYWIFCLFIAHYTFQFTKQIFFRNYIQSEGKAVLITGCDSGFGHSFAKRLDSKGFHVFACCYNSTGPGAEELKTFCSKRLKVLDLDVTKDESVRDAFQFVKNNLNDLELWALVNNAETKKGFSTDFSSIQDYKRAMEVNCFGMVRVTKAFLPFLKQSKGRIVNVTSVFGRNGIPHSSPYCTSKFAASGFTECLRLEMNAWDIKVIAIEPEIFKTPFMDAKAFIKDFETTVDSLDPKLREEYGEDYFSNFKTSLDRALRLLPSPSVHRVTDALESAVASEYPDIVYLVSRNWLIYLLRCFLEISPYSVRDLFVKSCFNFFSFPNKIKAKN